MAVVPNYPPRSRVGAFLATHQFMRHLVSEGHGVTVAAMSATGKSWTVDDVPVITGIRGRTHLAGLAREHDVVVSHFGDGGTGQWIAQRADKPDVRIVHGHINTGPECDLLVFNSQSSRDAVDVVRSPTVVCHPPTDPTEYATTPGSMVTIINLSEDKGAKVAWRVAQKMSNRPFLGVRGAYGTQLKPRVDNFAIVPTTRHMRDEVYAHTRVLLMPSAYETWGMTGIEAMASGIPVIAHPTPGLLESLGDAGIFVDRDNIAGWVAAIEALDDADEYTLASKRALARVAELDPSVSLERFADALRTLIGA